MVAVLIFGIFCTGAFAKDVFRRPLSLRAFGPRVLRWKTLARFLSSAPLRVRIPLGWAQKRKAPIAGSLSVRVVGDEGCRVRLRRPLPLRRFAPCVLRWKTLARFLSSAPLRVRIPLGWAQKRKAPIAGSLSVRVVGDEGCRVRLRRPLPLRRFAPCVLRWKTLARFLSSAP